MKSTQLFAAVALSLCACGGTSKPSGDGGDDGALPVVTLTARQWSYDPPSITLKKGMPVVVELTSGDVHHGFNLPAFNLRGDAIPGKTTRIKIVPDKTGTFPFHCDYYCGTGHEGMEGQIVVE